MTLEEMRLSLERARTALRVTAEMRERGRADDEAVRRAQQTVAERRAEFNEASRDWRFNKVKSTCKREDLLRTRSVLTKNAWDVIAGALERFVVRERTVQGGTIVTVELELSDLMALASLDYDEDSEQTEAECTRSR